jgi:hypothetical protein
MLAAPAAAGPVVMAPSLREMAAASPIPSPSAVVKAATVATVVLVFSIFFWLVLAAAVAPGSTSSVPATL